MKEKSLEWLEFARLDFQAAQDLLKLDERYAGISAYHAQQTAEKSIKAYLLLKNKEIKRTHDLLFLIEQCVLLDEDFVKMRTCSEYLDPFAVKTRYPDDARFELSLEEAQELVACSKIILEFVTLKINGS